MPNSSARDRQRHTQPSGARKMVTGVAACVSTALLIAACTDTAASSSGGSGASNSHGTAGKGASGTSASGPKPPLCDQFCNATASCFDDCQATCAAFQTPPCDQQGTALVTCLAANYDATACQTTGSACVDEYNAFTMCRTNSPASCAAPVCGAGSMSCACTSQCEGGEHKVICDLHPDGTSECSCIVNGLLLANCGNLPANGAPVTACTTVMMTCCADFGFGH